MSNSSKVERELEAQKARLKAMKYLASVGESVPSREPEITTTTARSRDNTLDLQLQSKVKSLSTDKLGSLKSSILSQQLNERSRASGPTGGNDSTIVPPWSKVLDPSTNLYYYWNVETNDTSWERPNPSSSVSTKTYQSSRSTTGNHQHLPEGWKELVHTATNQVYYYNEKTGERSSSFPSSSVSSTVSETKTTADKERKRVNEPTVDLQLKKARREFVDPLDFTGGMVRFLSSDIHIDQALT
jgi:hypothetical protein